MTQMVTAGNWLGSAWALSPGITKSSTAAGPDAALQECKGVFFSVGVFFNEKRQHAVFTMCDLSKTSL